MEEKTKLNIKITAIILLLGPISILFFAGIGFALAFESDYVIVPVAIFGFLFTLHICSLFISKINRSYLKKNNLKKTNEYISDYPSVIISCGILLLLSIFFSLFAFLVYIISYMLIGKNRYELYLYSLFMIIYSLLLIVTYFKLVAIYKKNLLIKK